MRSTECASVSAFVSFTSPSRRAGLSAGDLGRAPSLINLPLCRKEVHLWAQVQILSPGKGQSAPAVGGR